MTTLLIKDELTNNLNETSFGGLPVKGVGMQLEWPVCSNCNAEMQYLGKIKTDIGLELIFMCNHDPGMCDDWDPNSGGNKVIVVDAKNLEFFNPTNAKVALRETTYGVKVVEMEEEGYEDAREIWGEHMRQVLGKLNGQPSWIQSEEIPNCDCCNKPMRFVAQLEEGPDHKTAMNFGGGGCAYLFDCKDGKTAKFLWQC